MTSLFRMAGGGLVGVALLSCSGDRITGPLLPSEEGLVVSGIRQLEASALSDFGAALVLPSTAVYVSLVAGTVPDGIRAEIRIRGTDLATSVPMLEGGFDPVPIPAEEGDTVDVVARTADGGTRQFASTAQLRKPPVVVRTGPNRGASDVALNALIVIVFSEPMDGGSLGSGIRLTGPSGDVPFVLDLSGDDVTAALAPEQPLQPGTTYVLTVATTATSAAGLGLEEAYRFEFRTIVALPSSLILGIGPSDTSLEAGSRVRVEAALWDANTGNKVEGLPVRWTTSDPSVARVDQNGWVQSIGVGRVRIVAEIAGFSPVATLTFTPLRFSVVSAGGAHTCALTPDGKAWCWGSNAHGQLGTGEELEQLLPAPVQGDLRFASLEAGAEHTCGLTTDGITYCWGSDRHWQLGRLEQQAPGQPGIRPAPVRLPGAGAFTALAVGGAHGCGLQAGETVLCWGAFRGPREALYLDGARPLEAPPARLLASGGDHACAAEVAGPAWCWGRNDRGQLGDGTQTAHPIPTATADTTTALSASAVTGGLAFTALSAGALHTCGVAGGLAYCWGDAGAGRLGAGAAAPPMAAQPLPVAGALSFGAITAGGQHTCAIDAAARPWCWGANGGGQLGDGTRSDRDAPVEVSAPLGVTAMDAGAEHTCAISGQGLLYCWGRSAAGQVGSGFTGSFDSPVLVGLQK